MSLLKALSKHYDPRTAEQAYAVWEERGYFSSAPQDGRENYSIMLPPPNVTGTLHMGHAFQHTLMDILIRHRRMRGLNTLWQTGADHAGIATQIVVTRQLEKRGINAGTLPRDEFLRHAWEWKQQSGDTISQQMRRLGASCDWPRHRFTLDGGLSAAVTEAFVRLYEKGLIYRGKRLINWDPALLTAVSDLEVVSEEEDGVMYYVRYPFVGDEKNGVVIGTTRPETILVDGAIAVHPDDARFAPLVGKKVFVPLTEPPRQIEIIPDTHVNPDFGSGCVKITAAHDFNDYEVYKRHSDKNIPLIILFTPDAKMNDNAPKAYRGIDRFDARKRIVEDLQHQGLLVKQTPHRYKLPRGDRSGVVVEPMLTDQWFMRMEEPARRGLQSAADGKLRFVPDNWRRVYEQWLENIHDWCLSRQLIWGHQIPAWYDDDGNIYVARNEADAQRQAGDKPLRRDNDVLDTWFSSALWPFSTLDWPHTDNAHYAAYFPTSVLVTGFDILFFWVARMVMMSDHFIGDTPFHQVYITGLVRDSKGDKMSKSRGNILDPLDLVDGITLSALLEKRTSGLMNPKHAETVSADTKKEFPQGIAAHGADALRFTFASLASYGRDIKFDTSRCEGYRHFCNKLWNATRFVLNACENEDKTVTANGGISGLFSADDWIISRLQRAEQAVEDALAVYRFDLAAHEIYHFFWDDYCDWYLETAKIQLREGDAAMCAQTRQTLARVLEAGLRLCHPVIPFITEQLWQHIAPLCGQDNTDSIMLASYPQAQADKINEQAEKEMTDLKDAVFIVRSFRAEARDAATAPTLLVAGDGAARLLPFISKLGGVREARVVGEDAVPTNAPLSAVSAGGLTLVLESQADTEALRQRWQTQLETTEKQLLAVQKQLDNRQFVERAPAAVVEKKKQQRQELQATRDDMQQRLQRSAH